MQVKTLNTGIETIVAETEAGTRLALTIVGTDGSNYAVRWDAGDKWMCGEFVDGEDSGELYEINDEDREFTCDDNTKLVTVKTQCGGFKWEESAEVEPDDFGNANYFLNQLGTQDSNTVYEALAKAAANGDVKENQDWEAGESTWTFNDSSMIVMEGDRVFVRASR